jgi:hypothetical protein
MDKSAIERSIVERLRAAGDRGLTYAEWGLASGLDSTTAGTVWEEMVDARRLVKLGQRRGRAWAFKVGDAPAPSRRTPARRPREPRARIAPGSPTRLEARIRSLCAGYATALVDAIRRAPVSELQGIASAHPKRR